MSHARFSILQSRAVADKNVTDPQFRTLAALGTFGDRDGWCFPSLAALAEQLGKSRQAVSKDIQALVKTGYIGTKPQYRKDGSRTVNLYRLLFDVDTPQPDEVDTPSTPEVDTPQPPEVDALTPHSNASSNVPLENTYEPIDAEGNPLEKKKPTRKQRDTVPGELFKPMVLAIGEVMRWDMKLRSNWQVIDKKAKELILAGYTPENVRTAFGGGSRWYKDAWQAKGNKPPNLRNIVEYIGEYSGRVEGNTTPKYNAAEAKRQAQEALRAARAA